ncbi:hypothetical protein VTN00DRAFT_10151 [Thermoascus crustaceus]|uniref:mitochondrial 54S ribosomal protein bL31m n=1 Tax=Thermoascus crustaceus TaxID=5088 RepID=UPI0037430FCD
MSIHLPLRRSGLTLTSAAPNKTTFICTQCRHATLLRRPKRPYTFTQLVTLSDGSTFTHRTTSPMPVYRSTRDTRNSLLWNPSSNKLMNVEEDEAGRLAAFRAKFGRGYDAAPAPGAESSSTSASTKEEDKKQEASAPKDKKKQEDDSTAPDDYYDEDEDDNLLDLISSFGQEQEAASSSSGKKKR